METSPRKYLDVIGDFLPFSKNVAGPNVKRFIERPMEHMSAHVYTKDEVSQNKKKQTNICFNFNKNEGEKLNFYSTLNR